jgi:hypothetical protein
MRWLSVIKFSAATVGLAALAGVGYVATQGPVYQASLQAQYTQLAQNYSQLEADYQRVLNRTAITALRVDKDSVALEKLRADGSTELIKTPFSPDRELYVDYVVHGGQIQLRRLFDSKTPPGAGFVVNEHLKDVDWSEAPAQMHGQSVYRQLDPGRWVIDITGNGALGLVKADPRPLQPPPAIRKEPLEPLPASLLQPREVTPQQWWTYWKSRFDHYTQPAPQLPLTTTDNETP